MTSIRDYIALASALALIVTAVVGIAVRDPDQEETVALSSPTPSPSATAAPEAAATTAPSTPGPTQTQTAATPSPTQATGQAPAPITGEVTPPAPGAYTYTRTDDGETTQMTFRVSDQPDGRQTEVFVESGISSVVAWHEDGKYTETTAFSQEDGGFQCDWEPAIRELALPLREGLTWQPSGACEVATGVTVQLSGTARITGSEVVEVGGQPVATWIMATEGTLTYDTPQGSFEQQLTSQDRFSPAHGLYITSVETTEGQDPQSGQTTTQTSTRELVSLQPG